MLEVGDVMGGVLPQVGGGGEASGCEVTRTHRACGVLGVSRVVSAPTLVTDAAS